MLNRYNFASSSFEFSTFLSSRNDKKIACSPHFHLLHLSGVILQDYAGRTRRKKKKKKLKQHKTLRRSAGRVSTLPQMGGCCVNMTILGSIELFYLSQSVQWLQSVPILQTLMQIERCELNFVTAVLTRGGFSIIFILHLNVNGTFQRIIKSVLHSASLEIDLILKQIQLILSTRNSTYSVL